MIKSERIAESRGGSFYGEIKSTFALRIEFAPGNESGRAAGTMRKFGYGIYVLLPHTIRQLINFHPKPPDFHRLPTFEPTTKTLCKSTGYTEKLTMKKLVMLTAFVTCSLTLFAQDVEKTIRNLEQLERVAVLKKDTVTLKRLWSEDFTVNAPINK